MTEAHKKKLSEAMKRVYAEGRLGGGFKFGDENIAKRPDIRKKLSEKATGRKMDKPSDELIMRRAEGIKRTRIANGNFYGTGHPKWKGDAVGYWGIHGWIVRCLGSAKICEFKDETCSTKFEWSNKSKKYKRDFSDWQQLCASHHRRYDGHGIGQKRINGRFA